MNGESVMAEQKHTPAPWLAAPDAGEDYYNRPEGARPTIGILGGEEEFCLAVLVTDVFSPEQIEANAALIAAAPELLEAALAAKEILKPCLDEPLRTAFWKLADAIAKATGK